MVAAVGAGVGTGGLREDHTAGPVAVLPSLPAGLFKCDYVGRPDLVLPFAAVLIGVALIVGLPPGGPDFKQKSPLTPIEIIDLSATCLALDGSHKAGGQRDAWHKRFEAPEGFVNYSLIPKLLIINSD